MRTLTFLFCAFLFAPLFAFPRGPPDNDLVCKYMMPGDKHGNLMQSTKEIPYRLTTKSVNVSSGSEVQLQLKGVDGTAFKGVLVMARSKGVSDADARPLGFFRNTTGLRDSCTVRPYNSLGGRAVSHAHVLNVNNQTFTWVASRVHAGPVQFFATVVENLTVYWVKIPGPTVLVSRSAPLQASFIAILVSFCFSIIMAKL